MRTNLAKAAVAPFCDACARPLEEYVMEGQRADRALGVYHLILAPTHACNLRCRHCYLPDHRNRLLPEGAALGLADQWSDLVLQERGRFGGIFHVKGGEPFVVPYLSRLVERVVERGVLRLMLTTNGMFSDGESVAVLERANAGLEGNLTVIVSLDGATAESHDALRGEGTFARVAGFVEGIAAKGINTHLNCVLHSGNMHEVEHYLALARRLGAAQVNFLPLVPRGYGEGMHGHRPDPVAAHGVVQWAFLRGDAPTRQMLAGSLSHILHRERAEGIAVSDECVAGYRGLLYVTPDGSAYSCPNLLGSEHRIGNVNEDRVDILMERLPSLISSLESDVADRALVCTGERLHYETTGNEEAIASMERLQSLRPSVPVVGGEVSYCFSRNF